MNMRRWIVKRLFSKDERIMINDVLANAYFNHKRGEEAGKPKWTSEGVKTVLELEKVFKR